MNHLAKTLGQFLGNTPTNPEVPTLGDRELELMKIFWEGRALSAKQAQQKIADQSLSLSTMQTTLERLCRKKLLTRQKVGRYFVYEAAVSRAQIIGLLLGDITEQICDGDVSTLVSGFARFCDINTKGQNYKPAMKKASPPSDATDDDVRY